MSKKLFKSICIYLCFFFVGIFSSSIAPDKGFMSVAGVLVVPCICGFLGARSARNYYLSH